MNKLEELYKIFKERYVDQEKVTCLEGSYKGFNGSRYPDSNTGFEINIASYPQQNRLMWYDGEEDTLSIWGRGIGLVYREGYWAAKEGEDGPQYIPIIFNSPEIY